MDNIETFESWCKNHMLLCAFLVILMATVVQNCVADIGLGKYLGFSSETREYFSNNSLGNLLTSDIQPSEEKIESNELSVSDLSRTPSTCYPQQALKPEDLLPNQEKQAIQEFNTAQPVGEGILQGVNLLDAGSHIGINSVGQSLRNANQQLRSEPPNPQVNVSPWQNTTIGPDLARRPLELNETCETS